MKCNFKKTNNEVCKNNALLNDSKCYWHSKAIPESEKNKSRSSGGKSKIIKVNSNFQDHELKSIADVLKLNELLINKVLKNKLDLRLATGIGYLLNLQMKTIELSGIGNKNDLENIIINIKLPEELKSN